jgi:hypothetical protein
LPSNRAIARWLGILRQSRPMKDRTVRRRTASIGVPPEQVHPGNAQRRGWRWNGREETSRDQTCVRRSDARPLTSLGPDRQPEWAGLAQRGTSE